MDEALGREWISFLEYVTLYTVVYLYIVSPNLLSWNNARMPATFEHIAILNFSNQTDI